MCNSPTRNMENINEIKDKLEKIIDRAVKIEKDGCEFLGDPIETSKYYFCLNPTSCKGQGKTMAYQGLTPIKENVYCTIHIKKEKDLTPDEIEYRRNEM